MGVGNGKTVGYYRRSLSPPAVAPERLDMADLHHQIAKETHRKMPTRASARHPAEFEQPIGSLLEEGLVKCGRLKIRDTKSPAKRY